MWRGNLEGTKTQALICKYFETEIRPLAARNTLSRHHDEYPPPHARGRALDRQRRTKKDYFDNGHHGAVSLSTATEVLLPRTMEPRPSRDSPHSHSLAECFIHQRAEDGEIADVDRCLRFAEMCRLL